MPNHLLQNRNFPIPVELLGQLQSILSSYTGDKTVDGYKRLNNLINSKVVSYSGIKRLKNYFDNFAGDRDTSIEYKLNGGEAMEKWVNNTLETAREATKHIRDNKTDTGIITKERDTSGSGTNHNKGGNNNSLADAITKVIPNEPVVYAESKKRMRIIVTEGQLLKIMEGMIIQEAIENKKLYHGSNKSFDEFDDSKISTGDSSELFGRGYYLTDNIDIAEFYGKLITKKEKIDKYTNTGVFGTPEPVYSQDAESHAEQNFKINQFKINGNILNAKTFIIDEEFKNYIKTITIKYGGLGEGASKIVENTFNFLKANKNKINDYRGELLYILQQIGGQDDKIKNGIIEYIKRLGYDGVKYEPSKDFEGNNNYWNYVIYNKNIIHPAGSAIMKESKKILAETTYKNYSIVDEREKAIQTRIPYFLILDNGNIEERFLRVWVPKSQLKEDGSIPGWVISSFIDKLSSDEKYNKKVPNKEDILRYLGKTREEVVQSLIADRGFLTKTAIPSDSTKITDNIFINNIKHELKSIQYEQLHVILNFQVFLKTELSEKMVKEVLDNYVKKNINKFSENPAHNITMLEKSTINKIGNKIYYSARLGSGKQNIITISGGRPKNYTGD